MSLASETQCGFLTKREIDVPCMSYFHMKNCLVDAVGGLGVHSQILN